MLILYFPKITSTQNYLVQEVRKKRIDLPACVMSDFQTQGIGSRQNVWENVQNALMFSFAFDAQLLPIDLPRQSLSIYLGFLLKEWLEKENDELWLKWPNDLFRGDYKIGGVMSQFVGDQVVCGVGINLQSDSYASLHLDWNLAVKKSKIKEFLDFFFKMHSWADIFKNYKLEFHKNFEFTFHIQGEKAYFHHVKLCEDGSILWKNQKIYSSR